MFSQFNLGSEVQEDADVSLEMSVRLKLSVMFGLNQPSLRSGYQTEDMSDILLFI